MFRPLVLLVTIVALAACAQTPRRDSVRVGDSPAQVRERLGTPGAERKLAGENLAWYYMTGPSGFETWRVVFGSDGAVTDYAQVLTAANFLWLRDGANREEALDRLGPPMQRMGFRGTATDSWTYRWLDGTFEMISDAVFDAQSGAVKYVGIYRDPAYASTPSGFR
jgi:outer membrane protein assembly factor BamE (lipoprotein component of BamABCDE complex)